MALNLKNIFGKKTSDGNQQQATDEITIKGVTMGGSIIVASKIDWKKEGVNDAGSAKGDINAFSAGFNSAYARIKRSQELDQELQKKMREDLQADIINLEAERDNNKTKLEVEESSLKSIESQISDKEDEIAKVKDGKANKDKTIVANFVIGAVILLFMTLYLFIFYSSTGYSAFFRDFDTTSASIQTAMFYGRAIPQAFDDGIFEGFFIIFLPVLFMGLGFVVHQFSVNSKGKERYIKTFVLYALTFVFDFLLAYKISKAIYDIQVMTSLTPMPPFSLKIAFADMDFWIVIFCGFVAYIIWGLVFSFVMQNYDKMTSSKFLLETLQNELKKLQFKRADIQKEVTQLKNIINNLEAKIKQKTSELNNSVRYDFQSMLQYLANYYQGWVSYIALFGGHTDELAKSYDKEMESVNTWMYGIKSKFKKSENNSNGEDKQ
ncbi:MAG: hypothetical protein J6P44_05010 [Bacteroidales bacterium]|nr:hypothetical protein [Bacteroidales bacterium]